MENIYNQLLITILCVNIIMLFLTCIVLNIVKSIVEKNNTKTKKAKTKKKGKFNKSLGVREIN